MENYEDEELQLVFEDVSEFIQKSSYQYDYMKIATCMLARSLSLSKSCLSEHDFKKYCSYVLSNLDHIKPYDIKD